MFKPPLEIQRAEITHRNHDSEIMTVQLTQPATFQARQMTEGRLLVQGGELNFKRTVKTQEVRAHTLQVIRGQQASEIFAQEYQSPETIAALDENKRKTVLRRGLRLVPLMVMPGHPEAQEVLQAARLLLLSEPLDELNQYEGEPVAGAAQELAPAVPEPTQKRKTRSNKTTAAPTGEAVTESGDAPVSPEPEEVNTQDAPREAPQDAQESSQTELEPEEASPEPEEDFPF